MSLKKRLVSGAAALALAGTAALALDIAKDGTGDYLIAPVYVANGGWKTDIKVVNTNTTHAVVAKVVIREGANSAEVLDFPIYLTPGDVWSGTIYSDGSSVKIKSDDDSLMLGMNPSEEGIDCNESIKPITPVQVGLDRELVGGTDAKVNKGYVEVFGLAKYDAAEIAKLFGVEWSEGCDLNKTWLYTAARTIDARDNLNDALVTPAQVDDSDLMGEQVIVNEEGASVNDMRFMKLNMMALEGATSEAKIVDVLSNETLLPNVADFTEDEYKALLEKQHVFVMYDGDGNEVAPFQTIFTYPYMHNVSTGAVDSYLIGTDKVVFRDYEEHAKACGVPAGECVTGPCPQPKPTDPLNPEEDLSNIDIPQPEPECCPKIKYTDEVSVVVGGLSGEPAELVTEYAFKVGGYIDIDLNDTNITTADANTTVPSLPVIPTTMSARKVGEIYLNNHVYNQYAGPAAE